jgi:[ribosomal protein S5]-alanine N-acetyltransferase
MMHLTITTSRLMLRPFTDADARRVAYLAGDYEVAKMCGRVPHPYTMAMAYDWIGRHDEKRRGGEFAFAVTLERDELIGSCGVSRIGEGKDAPWELGYWFGMPYWGLGYASEAGQALIDWASGQLGAKVFGAGHFVDNPASGSVLRKLGFVRTGSAELFGLARQCVSPCERYVWPEGSAPVSLPGHPLH